MTVFPIIASNALCFLFNFNLFFVFTLYYRLAVGNSLFSYDQIGALQVCLTQSIIAHKGERMQTFLCLFYF